MVIAKKALASLCAVAFSVTLVACGGTQGDTKAPATTQAAETAQTAQTAQTTAASQAAPQTPAKAKPSLTGSFKLAGGQFGDATMVGNIVETMDLQQMSVLVVNEDGTGKLGTEDEGAFTWTKTSDTTATVKPQNTDSTFSMSVDDEAVVSLVLENDGESATMFFSADGTIPSKPALDLSKATDVSAPADVVGDWKMSLIDYSGVDVYGDLVSFLKSTGTENAEEFVSLSLKEDGTATLSGETFKWSIKDGKAELVWGEGTTIGSTLALKKLDDKLVLQMAGDLASMNMSFVYSK